MNALTRPKLSEASAPISSSEWFGIVSSVFLATLLILITVTSEWRQSLNAEFHPPFRTLLSKSSGDFTHTGVWLDILKVQTNDGLFIEIYATNPKQDSRLIERIKLTGSKDAYFHSHLQATRMVIEDIDNSGRPSIIVPSFDQDLVAHVNVFRILEDGQAQQVALNDSVVPF